MRATIRQFGMLAGITALVATMGIGVTAQGRGGPRHGGPGFLDGRGPGGFPRFEMLSVALDLTEAQQAQAKAILEGHKPVMEQLRERARAAHDKIDAAVRASAVDEAAIRAAVADMSQVHADGAVLRAKVRQELHALLTPEQKAKAVQLESARRGRGRRG